MKANDIVFLSWLYICLAIVSSIFAAFALEKRLKARIPTARPYRWGFYVGSMGLACAPLALFCGAAMIVAGRNERWVTFGECLAFTVFFALHAICGWFIVRRTRWAWVVGSLLSCNIFVWVINYVYGRNRWVEFGSQPDGSTGAELRPPASSPTSVTRPSLTKNQQVVLGVAAAVVAYFEWLSLSAEVARSSNQPSSAEALLINTIIGTVERFTSPLGIASVVMLGCLFYGFRQPRDAAKGDDIDGNIP